jgi:GMP synthase-like glutamine amidotransferase
MRIHYLQHVPFEDIGSMRNDFEAWGFSLSSTHWYRGDKAPALASFDALIVMGGPMGIYDEQEYPWLIEEKQLIRDAITAGKTLLGICLGAQLIADVLGGKVTRNPHKEIGWFPLEILPDARVNPVAAILARYPEVFHWHGDTFALPANALWIAKSQGCLHQAYCVDNLIWGFQFHLETTVDSARALIDNCASDIDGSRYTMKAADMLNDSERFTRINRAMSEVLKVIFPQGHSSN